MTPIRPCYLCARRESSVIAASGAAVCGPCAREHEVSLSTTFAAEPETPTIPPTRVDQPAVRLSRHAGEIAAVDCSDDDPPPEGYLWGYLSDNIPVGTGYTARWVLPMEPV